MTATERRILIEDLELATPPAPHRPPRRAGAGEARSPGIDLTAPPGGLIVGTNLVAFSDQVTTFAKGAVALNLLFAQEAAKADRVVSNPDLWVARHDMIFQNPLGWHVIDGSSQFTRHRATNMTVHQAIIPLLTAAFGPAAAVSSLILTGLTQLQQINNDKPWITLFDRESRRFEHQEYRFATADAANGTVTLRIAAFRFSAAAERIQVLFFKNQGVEVEFAFASRTLGIDADQLESFRAPLEERLTDRAESLIESIDLPAFQ